MHLGAVFFACLLLLCSAVFATQVQSTNLPIDDAEIFSTNDLSQVKLITFDVFAALMDLFTSLKRNVHTICDPILPKAKVDNLIQAWVSQYAYTTSLLGALSRNQGAKFANPNLFQQMLNHTLHQAMSNVAVILPNAIQVQLLSSWSDLIPWPKTGWVLSKLRNMTNADGTPRFKFATLSNGDDATLQNASRIFALTDNFKFDYILGYSGCGTFKPNPEMYAQVEKLGYHKLEVLHVAGAYYDALGAKMYGLWTAWLGKANQFDNITGNRANLPDYYLDDLSDSNLFNNNNRLN